MALSLNRKTVVRKFLFLSRKAEIKICDQNLRNSNLTAVEFDEQESFEHTKCKPLSIALAVQKTTRRILGIEVSVMPPKGPLARLALKKYGKRADERKKGRLGLLNRLKSCVSPHAVFESDRHPCYPGEIRRLFPLATHIAHKGQRGSMTGQGELKKIRFDPLFSLNHTCAMNRENINRLRRKTWCTTKKAERLRAHLYLYADYHNSVLI